MSDFIKCSSIHCKMDCKVLMEGYEVFRTWISNWTDLDVDNYITIQSLTSSFMLKSGCYQNVYQLSGVFQNFITTCVVGGRVVCNSNKQHHVEMKIAGVDACSLYPSAMYAMLGFLMGMPKVLTNSSYDFLKQQDGYCIITISIKVNKHLDFPSTSKHNEDGVIYFTSDMNKYIAYIDIVGL